MKQDISIYIYIRTSCGTLTNVLLAVWPALELGSSCASMSLLSEVASALELRSIGEENGDGSFGLMLRFL